MADPTEQVYLDAAEASVRALAATDRTPWTDEQIERTAGPVAKLPSHRAVVDSAYRAGHLAGTMETDRQWSDIIATVQREPDQPSGEWADNILAARAALDDPGTAGDASRG